MIIIIIIIIVTIIIIIIISACKGWEVDADFIGAISIFNFKDVMKPALDKVSTYWILPNGQWQERS